MIAARTILIGLVCVAISVAADALFLPHQSLWNDEVTQLGGMKLGPVETTRWLADLVEYDIGAPDDRMPPVSYYAGWAWTRVFGMGERPMRWFGVACVAIATAIVFASAHRAWGLGPAIAAALFLGTSPNVITMAVEIRAYPLLILMSSGIFACLVGYANGPIESRRRWLVGLVACGIVATYTHFFGLVALGGAMVAAFVLAIIRREKVLPVIVAGVVVVVASLGLVPFIRASVGISATPRAGVTAGQKVMAMVRLAYRLCSHPATSVSKPAVGVAILGFVVAVGCGFARRRQGGSATLGLILALASGLVAVTLAHLAQSAINAMGSNYNIWMLPGLALLIGSGLAAEARAVRAASLAAIAMLLSANAYSIAQLSILGDNFAHTAYGQIANQIRDRNPEKVGIVYDNDAIAHRSLTISVGMRHEFHNAFHEFSYLSGGPDATGIELADFPAVKSKIGLTELPYDELIVIRTQEWDAEQMAEQIRTGIIPVGDGPVTKALLASGKWERVGETTYLTFIGADVDVFRKMVKP